MSTLHHENFIWDLHIHTCFCPKGSSDFSEIDSAKEYVDSLIEIFKDHQDLAMISFTDHNCINEEVYKEFIGRKTGIVVIPGIELDTYVKISGELTKTYKHLIFYFDNETFDYDTHPKLINDYISEKQRSNPIIRLDEFLNFLLTKIKIKFLISPHAFKQDKRGIDFDWCSEEITSENINQYTDQFFCFWEASGNSDIAKGCKMLDEFESGDKVSLISFSDSNNPEKLKSYLSNPPQYFRAMPSFEGLRMVGSEPRRITRTKEILPDSDKGKYIGCVKTKGGSSIELSPRLNVIIGGRGSGKSILLDSIYLNHIKGARETSPEALVVKEPRKTYISGLSFSAKTMSNQDVDSQFHLQYLQQNYVYDLFSNVNELENKECFKRYFDELDDFDTETIKTDYLQKIDSIQGEMGQKQSESNLVDICGSVVKIQNANSVLKTKETKLKEPFLFGNPSDFVNATSGPRVVPKELKENKEFIKAQKDFFCAVQKIIFDSNVLKNEESLRLMIQNHYSAIIDKKVAEQKKKSDTLKGIQERLSFSLSPYLRRSRIIARIAQLQKIVETVDLHHKEIQGVDGHKFIIAKLLSVEEPLSYLQRMLADNFDARKLANYHISDKKDKKYLPIMVKLFVESPDDVLMDSSKFDGLLDSLEDLSDWTVSQHSCVYVQTNDVLVDLTTESPGTRANLLMEFIVSENKNIPLLIDQPEDNIDNETIAGKLTEWFSKMKNQRQLIVVTHDPNIVVNADAENVVVCKQTSSGVFEYTNGPLEDKDSLKAVVTILEGGRDALERRIGKYGK